MLKKKKNTVRNARISIAWLFKAVFALLRKNYRSSNYKFPKDWHIVRRYLLFVRLLLLSVTPSRTELRPINIQKSSRNDLSILNIFQAALYLHFIANDRLPIILSSFYKISRVQLYTSKMKHRSKRISTISAKTRH